MGVFRKKSVLSLSNETAMLAAQITVWILSFQRKLADRINGHLATIPRKRLVAYLGVCAVCMALYCFWLLVQAFY